MWDKLRNAVGLGSAELKWRDVIAMAPSSQKGFPKETKELAAFLDDMQTKPEGQALLRDIKTKYGDRKMPFSFDHATPTAYHGDTLYLDLRDITANHFKDARTGEFKPAGIPNLMIHELSHAADAKLELDRGRNGKPLPYVTERDAQGVPPSEHAAVARAREYIRKYHPELPEMAHYNDRKVVNKESHDFDVIDARKDPAISDEQVRAICKKSYDFSFGDHPEHEPICSGAAKGRVFSKPSPEKAPAR